MVKVIVTSRELGAGMTAVAVADAARDHLDPAHELYAHAAGVLAAAQALDAASHTPDTVTALAPTLACLESSLTALAAAADRVRGQALARLADPPFAAQTRRRHRRAVSTDLERLSGMLAQASIAAEQALVALEPVLDELTREAAGRDRECGRHSIARMPPGSDGQSA
jgi:hypothetical protein